MSGGVSIDQGAAVKVARNLGRGGSDMPDEIANDPALRKAYYDGAGKPDPDATPAPVKHRQGNPTPKPKTGGAGPASSPARTRGKSKGKVFTAGNAAGLVAHPARTLGTPGGLMLAIFIYPVLLNVLDHGPAGAQEWLAAKFLNKGNGTLASVKAAKGGK